MCVLFFTHLIFICLLPLFALFSRYNRCSLFSFENVRISSSFCSVTSFGYKNQTTSKAAHKYFAHKNLKNCFSFFFIISNLTKIHPHSLHSVQLVDNILFILLIRSGCNSHNCKDTVSTSE